MITKQKIKKGSPSLRELWASKPTAEKVLIFIPLVVAIALAIWIFAGPGGALSGSSSRANRELLLITDGSWQTFEDYGIDVWVPKDLPLETLDAEVSGYQKVAVQRDKGKFPEISFGVILAPDVDGRTFDLANDPGGVLDVTTPLITDAVGKMMNGAYPTITTDLNQISLANGQVALEGSGEAQVTLVFQDPKDPANQWSEETPTNLYYNVIIFHGRPIIVWGTWDYSTYEGEKRTTESVTDAVISIMRADGLDVMEPEPDYHDSHAPVVNNPQSNLSDFDREQCTWDDASQQWVGDITGEVHSELPHVDDPYWDDKRDDPANSDFGGVSDGNGNQIAGSPFGEIPSPTEQPDE